jgi:hypothetical protein
MKDTTPDDKTFLMWAKQTCTKHPEILEHMKRSHDALERSIAIRIMKLGGM